MVSVRRWLCLLIQPLISFPYALKKLRVLRVYHTKPCKFIFDLKPGARDGNKLTKGGPNYL